MTFATPQPHSSASECDDHPRIAVGNAEESGVTSHRGWFVGDFLLDGPTLRRESPVAVKWAVHEAGEQRSEPGESDSETSLAVLVSGSFQLSFPSEVPAQVVLSKRGDYVLYGPGVRHLWRALDDSVVLTVRWQSRATESGGA